MRITKLISMAFLMMVFTDSTLAQPERFEKLGVKLEHWSEGQVGFWTKIFTEYSTHEMVLHDSANLKIIYEVIPAKNQGLDAEKNRIRDLLVSISKKNAHGPELTEDEFKIYELFEANEDPRAYQFASENDRIRMQLGQKDRLENAFAISKRYLKRMEAMFEEEGVPKELTRLPFVESGFLNNAKSSVGALGIWQFMPKTAEKDLRVDSLIDERYDPLKSTRAAARFLKSNYKLLHNWSLAVMAYHHGPALVKKAVKQLKTSDPIHLIRGFKDPQFKFASRNYLFEFLAMLDVDSKHEVFFKGVDSSPLPAFITVSFQKKMALPEVIQQLKLKTDEIKLLNPHFLSPLWSGKELLPAHYPVRLSGISLEDFRKAFML